jgi:predicted GTPase
MSLWRVCLVLALLALPFLAVAGIGTYYLWTTTWGFWFWWIAAGVMVTGYVLAWRWQRRQRLLHPPEFTAPLHWTERDAQALKLVEARARAAADYSPAKLADVMAYIQTAQDMAQELAAFYYPQAQDPVGNLTIQEVLAVIELATHDIAERVDRYLPGSHLLTINNWRLARQATGWYRAASNLYYLIAAIFNPVNTSLRYATNKLGMSGPFLGLQQDLVLWFFVAFIERVGSYLIEVDSGRLRVGATRYRELISRYDAPEEEAPDGVSPAPEVTITLLGQVNAGKSSVINALLGEQKARTDVLPATSGVQRYELQPTGVSSKLVLLDTVGYAHTGPKADQVLATRDAAQKSDLLLLVLHARNPARHADLEMLKGLRAWYSSRPDLKCPPIVAVLTHIDLLSPAMDWSPPYNWQTPQRPKEENIHQALVAGREQIGEFMADVVPVCTAPDKVYGVEEWLLPVITARLDEARGVALLRCLKAEADTGKVRRIFEQLLAVGKEGAKVVWQRLRR